MRKKPRINTFALYEEDRERMSETNDCTVVSLAYALGITYPEAHEAMRRAGREHRRAAWMHPAVEGLEPGVATPVKLPYEYSITLAEFVSAHPRGRFLLGVTEHALVVVDGRICDHSDKVRRRVSYAWRINLQPNKESP